MWQIPTQTRYGCGYVYSDEFKTPRKPSWRSSGSSAARSRRAATSASRSAVSKGLDRQLPRGRPVIELPRTARTTSIHGTIVQMMLFADRYLKHPAEMTGAERDDYNARVGRQVDAFRSFVNTHYVVERDDTLFWRTCAPSGSTPRPGSDSPTGSAKCPAATTSADFLFGLPHVETQLQYPVLDGLGLRHVSSPKRNGAAARGLRLRQEDG